MMLAFSRECSSQNKSQWPQKGGSQLLTCSDGEEAKTWRGSFKFVTPAPKHEGKWLNCPW